MYKDIDSKIITWAKQVLKIKNNNSIENSKIIVKTPWSSVMAIDVGNEKVYLKHTPKLIGLEFQIIEILKNKFQAPVPTVIANNPDLSCFLMKDAGESLRSILKKNFKAELFCKAILQFTSLQISLVNHVNIFIDIGVPDWRLDKLPDLFKKALLQKEMLKKDGLLEEQINALENLLPTIVDLCKQLSSYAIKETIVQPDFNDNNNVIDERTGAITIIDLGEIAITHPFFSLINGLHVIKQHYNLKETEEVYLEIKRACLENYMKIESEKNVFNAFEIAHKLWYVYSLLAYKRLIEACDKEALNAHQHGKLSRLLKELINRMNVC